MVQDQDELIKIINNLPWTGILNNKMLKWKLLTLLGKQLNPPQLIFYEGVMTPQIVHNMSLIVLATIVGIYQQVV